MAEAGVNVCDLVVKRDLCIGCGICSGICPTLNLPMAFDQLQRFVPSDQGACLSKCTLCLDVCPFLDHDTDETDLGSGLFGALDSIHYQQGIGYYHSAYVGHVGERNFRSTGASGGLARWFLTSLLERRIVDRVACVEPSLDGGPLFRFAVFSGAEEMAGSAKSAYYPVEMSTVIKTILREAGRYAVIGLPCYLKAIRLAMQKNRRLRERIVLLAGLVCGQTKSAAYAEYLTRFAGLDPYRTHSVCFREKDLSKPATELVFTASSSDDFKKLYWSDYAEVWQTGQFKLTPCTFCDDVFAEVGDVAFMDAWLPEYYSDSQGTSIVLVRSELATAVIHAGVESGALAMKQLNIDSVVQSQAGVVSEKQARLPYRLWMADRAGVPRPKKRFIPKKPGFLDRHLLQAYERLRQKSHTAMSEQKLLTGFGLEHYQRQIRALIRLIRFIMRIRIVGNRVRGSFRRFHKVFRGD